MTKTIGVALGGGGAKGLAHIPVLEALDKMGVEVSALAGTSIGAIIGAAYAAGKSGSEIREDITALLQMPRSLEEVLNSKRLFGWFDLLSIEFGKSHILEADTFLEGMQKYVGLKEFSELEIPLQIVAAEFWERREVVFDSGPLMPAVAASFCLPGIFKPVLIDEMVLVDGGCVNPIPFDLLRKKCDIVVAVDVLGRRTPDEDLMPSYTEAIFNTFQIAETIISREKMKAHPPDIYLEPTIREVKVLEFHKVEEIFTQCEPECRRLISELSKLLATDC